MAHINSECIPSAYIDKYMKCDAKKKFSNVLFSPLRCSCLACRRRGKRRSRNPAMQIFKIYKHFYGKRYVFFAWFIMVEVPVPSPLLLLDISDETLSPSTSSSSISSSSDSSDIRLSLSLILPVSTSTSTSSSLLASSSKARRRCSRLALSSPAALLHFKKHPLFKALS